MTTSPAEPRPRRQPPPASCLWPTLAFFGTLAVGLAATIFLVRFLPPDVPQPTEAYEGYANGVTALFQLFFGAVLSILIALFTAIVVAVRAYAKVEPTQRELVDGEDGPA
jgi:hypothetical protein